MEIESKRYTINAQVHTISGYSAHADQRNLVNFVKRMRYKPKEIRLVHGDEEAKRVLAGKLGEVCPQTQIVVPQIDNNQENQCHTVISKQYQKSLGNLI